MAQNYIKEINISCNKGIVPTESKLNQYLTLLRTSATADHFDPNDINVCIFFSNLLELLAKTRVNETAGLLWSAIGVLEKAEQNQSARTVLVENYRILPVLADVLQQLKDGSDESTIRLLTLLQEYTYGVRITWQEPYLETLIDYLVQNIVQNKGLGNLSLSVLVNLCYKNPPAINAVLHTCPLSVFVHKIENLEMWLASKMHIVLENTTSISDTHRFIELSITEIENSLNSWNVASLKHIVSFIVDLKNSESTCEALETYKNFNFDVQRLMKAIENRLSMEDDSNTSEIDNSKQLMYMALIFKLFTCLLAIDRNLADHYKPICQLAEKWIEPDLTSTSAIDLIAQIFVCCSKDPKLSTYIFPTNFERVLKVQFQQVEAKEVKSSKREHALLNLIAMAAQNQSAYDIMTKVVSTSFFMTILEPLMGLNTSTSYHHFSDDDIKKYLHVLHALVELSKTGDTTEGWRKLIIMLLTAKSMHHILATGIISEQEDIRTLLLTLTGLHEFPRSEVSKILGTLLSMNQANKAHPASIPPSIPHRPVVISHEQCNRNNVVVANIQDAINRNQLNDVLTSQLVEVYEFKQRLHDKIEAEFQQRLQLASQEISGLSQRVAHLNCETQSHQRINFALVMATEASKMEVATKKQELVVLRETLNDFERKLNEAKKMHAKCNTVLVTKINEIERLNNNVEYLNDELAKQKAENKRNEEIRGLCKSLNNDVENLHQNVEDKKAELITLNRKIQEMEKEVAKLAGELVQKDSKIQQCENELKENQNIQNAIMNMMQNKKLKK